MPLLRAEGRGPARGAAACFPPQQPPAPPRRHLQDPLRLASARPPAPREAAWGHSLRRLTISVPRAAGTLPTPPTPNAKAGHPIDHTGLARLVKTFLGAWIRDSPPRALLGPSASVKTIKAAPAQSCCLLPSNAVGPRNPPRQTTQNAHLPEQEVRRGGEACLQRGVGVCVRGHTCGGWGGCRARWPT